MDAYEDFVIDKCSLFWVPGNKNSNKSNTEELTFLIIYEIEDKLSLKLFASHFGNLSLGKNDWVMGYLYKFDKKKISITVFFS